MRYNCIHPIVVSIQNNRHLKNWTASAVPKSAMFMIFSLGNAVTSLAPEDGRCADFNSIHCIQESDKMPYLHSSPCKQYRIVLADKGCLSSVTISYHQKEYHQLGMLSPLEAYMQLPLALKGAEHSLWQQNASLRMA